MWIIILCPETGKLRFHKKFNKNICKFRKHNKLCQWKKQTGGEGGGHRNLKRKRWVFWSISETYVAYININISLTNLPGPLNLVAPHARHRIGSISLVGQGYQPPNQVLVSVFCASSRLGPGFSSEICKRLQGTNRKNKATRAGDRGMMELERAICPNYHEWIYRRACLRTAYQCLRSHISLSNPTWQILRCL